MPSLDHLHHPHMLFRQEQTNKGTRLKGLFLTWLPTLPSHPHVPSTHITPDRSLPAGSGTCAKEEQLLALAPWGDHQNAEQLAPALANVPRARPKLLQALVHQGVT